MYISNKKGNSLLLFHSNLALIFICNFPANVIQARWLDWYVRSGNQSSDRVTMYYCTCIVFVLTSTMNLPRGRFTSCFPTTFVYEVLVSFVRASDRTNHYPRTAHRVVVLNSTSYWIYREISPIPLTIEGVVTTEYKLRIGWKCNKWWIRTCHCPVLSVQLYESSSWSRE